MDMIHGFGRMSNVDTAGAEPPFFRRLRYFDIIHVAPPRKFCSSVHILPRNRNNINVNPANMRQFHSKNKILGILFCSCGKW